MESILAALSVFIALMAFVISSAVGAPISTARISPAEEGVAGWLGSGRFRTCSTQCAASWCCAVIFLPDLFSTGTEGLVLFPLRSFVIFYRVLRFPLAEAFSASFASSSTRANLFFLAFPLDLLVCLLGVSVQKLFAMSEVLSSLSGLSV